MPEYPFSNDDLAKAIEYAGDTLYASGQTTTRYIEALIQYKELLRIQRHRASAVYAPTDAQ